MREAPSSQKESVPLLPEEAKAMAADGSDVPQWSRVNYKTTKELLDDFFPVGKAASDEEIALLGSKMYMLVVVTIFVNAIEIGLRVEFPEGPNIHFSMNKFFWCELYFFIVYSVEAFIKLKKLGAKEYFTDGFWNPMDFVITFCAFLQIFQSVFQPVVEDYEQQLKMLKIFGLLRLLRILRLMRLITSVKDLAVTAGGLTKSIKPLAWIVLVLFIFCYGFAIYFATVLKVTGQQQLLQGESWNSLPAAIKTMIGVVVVDGWTEIFDVPDGTCDTGGDGTANTTTGCDEPMGDTLQFLLIYLPFYGFALLVVFGISNIIIGVIVDATNETKTRLEWDDIRDEMLRLGEMWEAEIHQKGLSRQAIQGLSPDEQKLKIMERREAAKGIMSDIIAQQAHIFPPGLKPDELRMVCDIDGDGTVSHNDFVQCLSQILLCTNTQQRVLGLVNQARTRRLANQNSAKLEVVESQLGVLTERLDTVVAMLGELKKGLEEGPKKG